MLRHLHARRQVAYYVYCCIQPEPDHLALLYICWVLVQVCEVSGDGFVELVLRCWFGVLDWGGSVSIGP